MKWLASFVRWAAQHDKVILDDLRFGNAAKPGLGDQTAAYVRSGEGETVLSALSVACQTNEGL